MIILQRPCDSKIPAWSIWKNFLSPKLEPQWSLPYVGGGGPSKFGQIFLLNRKSDPVDSNWVSTVADPTCVSAVDSLPRKLVQ